MIRILFVVVLIGLAGCQAYPSTPAGSTTVTANYQKVSDCFFLRVRGDGYWRKEELPSMNTSQVVLGNNNVVVGRIDFVGIGASQTRVDVLFPTPIQGKDYYPNRFLPVARSCAAA